MSAKKIGYSAENIKVRPSLIRIICLFFLVIAAICCDSAQERLRINITSIVDSGQEEVRTDSIREVTSEYFEVNLERYRTDSTIWYEAKKDIKLTGSGRFEYQFFKVVGTNGKPIQFETSTEFLSYMSARHYALFAKDENSYMFKRD